jgi:hypothetical protein
VVATGCGGGKLTKAATGLAAAVADELDAGGDDSTSIAMHRCNFPTALNKIQYLDAIKAIYRVVTLRLAKLRE